MGIEILSFTIKVKKQNDFPFHRFDSIVGIHRANFADFILDLRYCYLQVGLFIGFIHKYRVLKSTLAGNVVLSSLLYC
jgi:hypothetical protein